MYQKFARYVLHALKRKLIPRNESRELNRSKYIVIEIKIWLIFTMKISHFKHNLTEEVDMVCKSIIESTGYLLCSKTKNSLDVIYHIW